MRSPESNSAMQLSLLYPKFDVSEKANAPSAGGGVNGDVESLDYTVGLASSAGGSGLM